MDMSAEELVGILRLHKDWLEDVVGGSRAYLEYANLNDANLKGANLKGANLYRTLGIYHLNMSDPRGYRPLACQQTAGWKIHAGCRWLSVNEALQHWNSDSYVGDKDIAARYVGAIREFSLTNEYAEGHHHS